MAQKITKALIPAAGFGTRFLPQTKAMPKEMMPLVDKPIIQRVVEELVEAGIETVVIVTGWNKRSIEDHFDNNFELERKLEEAGKIEELALVRQISDMAEFVYIRQKGPMGTGTPVLNAKHIMGDDPFLIFWGDEFVDAKPSRAKQLIDAYERYQTMILGTIKYEGDDGLKKYGYVGGDSVGDGVFRVKQFVEKPGTRENAPSNFVGNGGIVATVDIYEALEELMANKSQDRELYLTDGTQKIIDKGIPVHAIELQNAIYRDTGNKIDYLKTVIEYGLMHPDTSEGLKKYLTNLVKNTLQ